MKERSIKHLLAGIAFLLAACQPVSGTQVALATSTSLPPAPSATAQPTAVPTLTSTPTVPPSINELPGAELPPGFSLLKFAAVERPTGFAFDLRGRMYVTSQDGNIYLLQDQDADGRADSHTVFSSGYEFPLGVAVHAQSGDIYVSHLGQIGILRDMDGDGQAEDVQLFAGGFPNDKHQNDNLEFGPDGMLYMGLGSTCDACQDPDPRSAAILRFDVNSGHSEIFATGLRNPYDIAFHPVTGDLFATDNGRDDLGMEAPFEELNHIVQGGNYGYPDCWNEQDQPGCEGSIPAIAFFEAHSSANSIDFPRGEAFPAEYRENLFLAIFGSWLKSGVQTGVQRVVLTRAGESYEGQAEWFIRFPEGAMPLPLLFGPDGALYVGDYTNNAIYRISWGGG